MQPPSLLRWLFSLAVLAAMTSVFLGLATLGPVGAVVGGLLLPVPLCSLGEWLVHGFLYHRGMPGLTWIRDIHHAGHHWALFPPQRYVNRGSPFAFMRLSAPWQMASNAQEETLTKWSQILLHFVVGIPLILLPAYVLTGSLLLVGCSTFTLAVISYLLADVHGHIHTPVGSWIERQSWFCALDRQHYIHHMDEGANLNFMLPLVDLLLGTRRFAPSESEQHRFPDFSAAKPMAWDVQQVANRN